MRAAKSQSRTGNEAAAGRRRKRERAGRLAELLAAAFLVAKGYRIRGRRLAFVEEK